MMLTQKKIALTSALLFFSACNTPISSNSPITLIIDRPPLSFQPKTTLDAQSRSLFSLVYRNLVKYDEKNDLVPDLASRFSWNAQKKSYDFEIQENLSDSTHQTVDASTFKLCLETSIPKPSWKKIETDRNKLRVFFEKPDSFFLDLLTRACFLDNGKYHIDFDEELWVKKSFFLLHPREPSLPEIKVQLIKDDNARALSALNQESDLSLNAITVSKEDWIRKKVPEDRILNADSDTIDFLYFNLEHPILSHLKVRQALVSALPLDDIQTYRFFNFLKRPDFSSPHVFSVAKANTLLDEAGFLKDKNGFRFSLRYQSTLVREGIDRAILFQKALALVGVELKIEITEPSRFFIPIQKGNYELFASRLFKADLLPVFFDAFHSKGTRNYVHFKNAELDRLIEKEMNDPIHPSRVFLKNHLWKKLEEELPVAVLWQWKHFLLRSERVAFKKGLTLPLSGYYDFLPEITLKERIEK